ncbi:MAG: NFACT family protein [Oscillospiraceae bacterium]|nr:NFACT family protein [Oscillospiraceae bacterium]
MPLDAVYLSALLTELRPQLVGARVDKVQQPERDKLLLSMRGGGGKGKLLLAAGVGSARLHFTDRAYENPASPPMFCMLLRKHLTGARLAEIIQPPMERVARLEFDTYNELGEPGRKALILELLGRYTNLILLDGEGRIVDALRRIDEEQNPSRRILPGLRYHPPEIQGNQSPLACTRADQTTLLSAASSDTRLDNWLLDTYLGLSPLICRELTNRTFGQTDARLGEASPAQVEAFQDSLQAFFNDLRNETWAPYALQDAAAPVDFSYTPIHQYGDQYTLTQGESFSSLLDGFYETRDQVERKRQQAGNLIKTVTNLRDRTARKLETQRQELTAAGDRDKHREQGDLIQANLHTMKRGESTLRAQNFYDPEGGEVEIPLDPRKTPQQNAAAYYKRYTKAKNAELHLADQITRATEELAYLESVLASIDRAETAGDIAQIRQELIDVGLLRQGSGKKQKPPPARPLEFESPTGFTICAGKNNVQNDQLSFKAANRGDLWFHAQKLHGSHVVIETGGREPDDETIEAAAQIAAWYSKGREAGKVPVDYTLVKHVKKPSGGKPGAANYVNFKTIYVTPDEARINRLKK